MLRRPQSSHLALRSVPITLLLLLALHLLPNTASAQDKCSFTKTNHDCEITLDRNSFVFPASLQMYPKSVVTVRIKNGNDFELYTLDPAPGQASPLPDVTSSTATNLNGIFASASTLAATVTSPAPPPNEAPSSNQGAEQPEYSAERKHAAKPDPCKTHPHGAACREEHARESAPPVVTPETPKQIEQDHFDDYKKTCDPGDVSQFSSENCMLSLLKSASQHIVEVTYRSKGFYSELDTLLTPDAQPPLAHVPLPDASRPHVAFDHLLNELCGQPSGHRYYLPCGATDSDSLIHQQADASAAAAALLARMTKPPTDVTVPSNALYAQPSQPVLNAMQLLTEEQAALDAIRKDLEGYASRLQDLLDQPAQTNYTVGVIQDSRVSRHLSRTVTYTLNRLNLVSNSQEAANDGSKKSPIVNVVLVYGEARWDASSGIAVVFRPIRTFTVAAPIATTTGTLPSNSYISESKATPELAPFAAADYRLGNDFKLFGWRGALYATAGVGYNTSQQSADYLVGPSISWRSFLLSGLCDFGHGVRLAPGYANNDPLASGTTATTPPTQNYWVPAFTIGVSVRIPGITGR